MRDLEQSGLHDLHGVTRFGHQDDDDGIRQLHDVELGLADAYRLDDDSILPLVDYEYLTIAFGYLFDLLAARQESGKIRMEAVENPQDWSLNIAGVEEADLNLIQTMHSCKTNVIALSRYALLPELILGLHVACEIFHLQDIDMETIPTPQGEQLLRLTVPIFINRPMES